MGEEQNHLFGLKKMGEDKKSESLKNDSLMGEFCTVGFKRYDFLEKLDNENHQLCRGGGIRRGW